MKATIQTNSGSAASSRRMGVLKLVGLCVLAFALACGLTASAQTSVTTNNFAVGATIPDASASGLVSVQSVSTPIAYMTGLKVALKVSGTYNGDLYCYLVHSSGRSVLLNRAGRRAGSGLGYGDDGFDVTFDDAATNGDVHVYRLTLNSNHNAAISGSLTNSWAPDARTNSPLSVLDTDTRSANAMLSSFNGLNPNGEWILFIADLEAGDVQVLDNWGLEITGYTAPSITQNPASQTNECSSGSAMFSVNATGTTPLSYQWRYNTNAISGETNSTLTVNSPIFANAGNYDIVITNNYGSVTSLVATLTIADTTAPLISMTGAAVVTNECHVPFVDPGATASDTCAGPLAVVTNSTVNANLPGSYQISYSAVDPSGNATTNFRTVVVSDTTPPTVLLTGASVVTNECHVPFVDPGATASDTCAGPLAVVTNSTVNANLPGSYQISYAAVDPSGNATTNFRTVVVSDTTPPTVLLTGAAVVTNECHVPFVDPGATASDTCAGPLAVVTNSTVNANLPGSYTIAYSAVDPSGNATTNFRTVVVSDTTPPTVLLTGAAVVTNECHVPFVDPGATASDTCAGPLAVVTNSTVNANLPGSYQISYAAVDPSGNATTNFRTVVVSDTTPPTVLLTGAAVVTNECHVPFVDPGATASDTCAGPLAVVTNSTVNANLPGSYQISYAAVDPSGNATTNFRTVVVSDTTPPTVLLTGAAVVTNECHVPFVDPGATASDTCAGPLAVVTNSTVNANLPGSYTIAYSAVDPSGNATTNFRTVVVSDTTPPTVLLTGASVVTNECHVPFVDPGATASDTCAGPLAVVTNSTVNANLPGSYTIAYSAVDPSGNATTNFRTVVVSDTTPPTVLLTGASVVTNECHVPFVDPGATASDTCAGPLAVVTNSTVNANLPGSYTIAYSAVDPSGNATTNFRTVVVNDTTLPVVTLVGNATVTNECHVPFVDPGATASDTCAGPLAVVTNSTVNANLPGSYTIAYSAVDPSGNATTNFRTVVVSDTTPPTVLLTGAAVVTNECHVPFVDPGATASDTCAGPLAVVTNSTVNANLPGSYQISYAAVDPSGNATTNFRTVVVSDTTPPTVLLTGASVVTNECHVPFVDPGATASDTCAGPLAVVTNSTVNANLPGSYTIAYSAVDPSGNATTNFRTVVVSDTTPPTVLLTGASVVTNECHVPFVDPGATASDTCAGPLAVVTNSTVNANLPGSYTIAYSAVDPSGNATTNFRTVVVSDTTPPTVLLTGAAVVTNECHVPFVDPGATASDTCAGPLAVVTNSTVNANLPGSYTIAYSAVDPSGNATTNFRTVVVNDTTLPVVTLVGNATVTNECHVPFVDPGATASDTCAGPLAVVTNSTVNANLPGSYTIAYSAVDPSGNATTNFRTVVVNDTTLPVVTLVGNATVTNECHVPFVDPGATASDTCAGTLAVVTNSTVNANLPGSYTIAYSAVDPSGNATTNFRTVVVNDTTLPSISCSTNISVFTTNVSGATVNFTVTASDTCAGTLTPVCVPPSGSLFGVGTNTVMCTATDPSGNSTNCSFTVTVLFNNAPVATNDTLGVLENNSHGVLIEKLLSNDFDADNDTLTITSVNAGSTNGSVTLSSLEVIYTPATNFVGADSFTYTVSDGRGGTATATVVVDVRSEDTALNIIDITDPLPNTVRIRFMGIPGFSYRVQRATTLNPSDWMNIGSGPGTVPASGLETFDDTTPPPVRGFYRIISPSP